MLTLTPFDASAAGAHYTLDELHQIATGELTPTPPATPATLAEQLGTAAQHITTLANAAGLNIDHFHGQAFTRRGTLTGVLALWCGCTSTTAPTHRDHPALLDALFPLLRAQGPTELHYIDLNHAPGPVAHTAPHPSSSSALPVLFHQATAS